MTERKTTEIKIRVTPSFKARVQGAADAAGVSLTEWLEEASEEKMLPLAITDRKVWDYTRSQLVTIAATTPVLARADSSLWTKDTHPAKSWMYEGKDA